MFINTLVSDPVLFVRIVVILIVSITLHELAHGVAAISQGDNTPKLTGHMTLNPVVHMGVPSLIFLCIAGIAWGQMPVNPSKFKTPQLSNIIVSAAGPFSNFGLALISIMILKVMTSTGAGGLLSPEFLILFAHTNLILFLFNLLPIPPLDGFHIASEFFPELKSLANSNISLFALALLFLFPQVGQGLSALAFAIVQILI
jgi:Zn-dependent protease